MLCIVVILQISILCFLGIFWSNSFRQSMIYTKFDLQYLSTATFKDKQIPLPKRRKHETAE